MTRKKNKYNIDKGYQLKELFLVIVIHKIKKDMRGYHE
ncbi:hypothetical protein FH5_04200 [Priestia endophytica]|nr:hypothetical protein FH5_04200 [Priestia endophytica]